MSQKPPRALDPTGILVIDKPSGMTSHDVVHKVRKTFGYRKVGHAGTLDPAATGVLVLLIGKATKLQSRFLNDDKVYRGTIRLGEATSTYDAEGEVTDRHPGPLAVDEAAVRAAITGFVGEIAQMPPMVSAIKHKGKPLYKYARQGIEIERKPRDVTIHRYDLLAFDGRDAEVEVACSKGTYIRSLAHDLGLALGCFAHLATLRRTVSGPFGESDLQTLDQVLASARAEVLYLMKLPSEMQWGDDA